MSKQSTEAKMKKLFKKYCEFWAWVVSKTPGSSAPYILYSAVIFIPLMFCFGGKNTGLYFEGSTFHMSIALAFVGWYVFAASIVLQDHRDYFKTY